MPLRCRELIEDACQISIQVLYRSGMIRRGHFTEGMLLGRYRFRAYLDCVGIGYLELGESRWLIESRSLGRRSRKDGRGILGGVRLYLRGSNRRRHLHLYITSDGRFGTRSELNLIWKTKRLSKIKRKDNRRMKLYRRVKSEWSEGSPEPIKPRGMWTKRYRRLMCDGVYYPRKRMLNKDRGGLNRELRDINRVFGGSR